VERWERDPIPVPPPSLRVLAGCGMSCWIRCNGFRRLTVPLTGTVMKVDLIDINERGDRDFDSLCEVEKNLYVLLLFSVLHEMEGITHFFSYHMDHVPRVLDFLAAIEAPNSRAVCSLTDFLRVQCGGTLDSDALEQVFSRLSDENLEKINAWEKDYYSNYQGMWARAEEYVRQRHGIEFK
jgi:hypothetical protein